MPPVGLEGTPSPKDIRKSWGRADLRHADSDAAREAVTAQFVDQMILMHRADPQRMAALGAPRPAGRQAIALTYYQRIVPLYLSTKNRPEPAIEFLRTVVTNGYVPEIAFAGGFQEEEAFRDASAGSFPTGLFGYRYVNPLTAPNGTKYEKKSEQDMLDAIAAGDVILSPFISTEGHKPGCGIEAAGFAVPAGAKNPEAAYDYINWIMSPAQNARVLEEQPAAVLEHASAERLDEKFGWLRDYRQALGQWSEYQHLLDHSVDEIRRYGYCQDAAYRVALRIQPFVRTDAGRQLKDELLTFISSESAAALPGERLPGSSEALESAFGKLKSLEGDHQQGGFTSLLRPSARSWAASTRRPSATRWSPFHGSTLPSGSIPTWG